MISLVLCHHTQIFFYFFTVKFDIEVISLVILLFLSLRCKYISLNYIGPLGEILKSSSKILIQSQVENICIYLYIFITQKIEAQLRRGYTYDITYLT